jgi:uncharacterized membrane protein
MGKGRLEAFSDGVFAVAITLLVLDLRVDTASSESLATQLGREWPSFVAYAISFFVIGILWVNHHALFALIGSVDRSLMFLNILLMMFVVTIPFTTATLAGYLSAGGSNARVAVLLYGASAEGMAISFTVMLAHMINHGLLLRPVSHREGRMGVLRFGVGTVIYPVATVIGLFSPIAMLIFYGLLSAFYILEQTPILPSDSTETNPGDSPA